MTDARGRVQATIRGRVQGVGFRWFVSRTANRLELRGWVANRPDGSVRAVAEGQDQALEAFIAALRHGPPGAVVDAVDVERSEPTGTFRSFEIRSGSHPGD
jgi:acylphosphatase